ncbi:type IV toxin-antitoxin system AbiEi family antitoxin [Alteromonas lipolytica]|uniref:AbiEi antitoxin C-terminal domain-containing protein n=1 Tax=Alteromonas lipolytica TaxID=1856405 RepID=A0A1E8FF19_9ALTE|nr:DUF6088 family protein [Alteromonas lipolytica]OFI34198.1 hypothetical protein BFC17_21920 [Alteromonas lipolytica]GGF84205.1 hypothetical protein GCM10011338_40620 [Alteromonas lipolytica]
MKLQVAISRLNSFDEAGRYVFLHRDLAKIFHEDSERTLNDSLARFVRAGLLERVARGVYLYGFSRYKKSSSTIEHIAIALRRGHYNYISNESALSAYGIISQIPNRLTIMTTGSKGTYKTNYGIIEFTHTKRSVIDILAHTIQPERPLRLATKTAAVRDLKRIGRNTHMIEMTTFSEEE